MNFKGIYNKDKFILKTNKEQNEYFELLNETFNKDKSTIAEKIQLLNKEAAKNNIVVIDYLGMLYFGDNTELETSLYYATCLSLYASANGSKLASSRIRSLLQPAYNYIMQNIDRTLLYDIYNLTDKTCDDFIYSHISAVIIFEKQIKIADILEMQNNLSEYSDFNILDLEDLRDDLLNNFVEYLAL